jgi:hypothetical protein
MLDQSAQIASIEIPARRHFDRAYEVDLLAPSPIAAANELDPTPSRLQNEPTN